MSNYKTHNIFNIFITYPIFSFIIYSFFHFSLYEFLIFSSVYFYCSFFMSPDVDIAHKIKFFSLRGFLTFPFRSYSRIFKHRGLSHHLLLGSITRIVWLSLWALLILYLCHLPLKKPSFIKFIKSYQSEIIWSFTAIFLADLSHILLDKIKVKK